MFKSGCGGEEKISLPSSHPANSLVTILTELFQLIFILTVAISRHGTFAMTRDQRLSWENVQVKYKLCCQRFHDMWAGRVACTREMSSAYKILVVKPEGKKPLRRPRHRWKVMT
jgi:hypothetical protein